MSDWTFCRWCGTAANCDFAGNEPICNKCLQEMEDDIEREHMSEPSS